MTTRKLWVLVAFLYLVSGCVPVVTNACIDAYYETLEQTDSRDDAALAYFECAESR